MATKSTWQEVQPQAGQGQLRKKNSIYRTKGEIRFTKPQWCPQRFHSAQRARAAQRLWAKGTLYFAPAGCLALARVSSTLLAAALCV